MSLILVFQFNWSFNPSRGCKICYFYYIRCNKNEEETSKENKGWRYIDKIYSQENCKYVATTYTTSCSLWGITHAWFSTYTLHTTKHTHQSLRMNLKKASECFLHPKRSAPSPCPGEREERERHASSEHDKPREDVLRIDRWVQRYAVDDDGAAPEEEERSCLQAAVLELDQLPQGSVSASSGRGGCRGGRFIANHMSRALCLHGSVIELAARWLRAGFALCFWCVVQLGFLLPSSWGFNRKHRRRVGDWRECDVIIGASGPRCARLCLLGPSNGSEGMPCGPRLLPHVAG